MRGRESVFAQCTYVGGEEVSDIKATYLALPSG